MAKSRKQRMGDDDAMIMARHHFLNLGHYAFLRQKLVDMVSVLQPQTLIDLGCGDGYYTNAFQQALPHHQVFGVDLSKRALKLASKDSQASYFISSIADLPIMDHQIQLVSALFVPHQFNEIKRILAKNGHVLLVSVGPDHLIELKQLLYPKLRLNPPIHVDEAFEVIESHTLSHQALLDADALRNLFHMTPYFYTTQASRMKVFENDLSLNVSFQFEVLLLRMKSG